MAGIDPAAIEAEIARRKAAGVWKEPEATATPSGGSGAGGAASVTTQMTPVTAPPVQDPVQAEIDRRATPGGQASGGAKAFATGVRSGAEGTAGFLGDVPGMVSGGTEWLLKKLGADPAQAAEAGKAAGGSMPDPLRPSLLLKALEYAGIITPEQAASVGSPTSAAVGEFTDKAVNQLPAPVSETVSDVTRHVPANRTEEILQTAGGFAGGALRPGGLASRALQVAVPTAATEAAGAVAEKLAPEYEDAARVVAGIISGGATSARNQFRTRSALRTLNTSPEAVKRVERLLLAQGMSPEDAAAEMRRLGVGSKLVDTGSETRLEAQQLQAAGGEARGIIDPELRQREKGANARLERDVTDAYGPHQQPSVIERALADRKKELGPDYKAAHAGQTQPVDTQSIVHNIETDLASVKSPSLRNKMKQVLDSLYILDSEGKAAPNLDPSSEGLHNARIAIDDMLYDQTGRPRDVGGNEARILKDYRRQIDEALGSATPIKEVDAKYEQVSKEERAFKAGQEAYENPRGGQTPTEFKDTYDAMTPGEQSHLLSGMNVETWRQLGIASNDKVKLQQILRGDGKWNHQKVATVIGEEKAGKLMAALEREKVFSETYQRVVQGSKTAETTPKGRSDGLMGHVADVGTTLATGGWGAAAALALNKLGRTGLAKMMTRANSDPDIARLLMSSNPDDVTRAIELYKRTKKSFDVPEGILGGIAAGSTREKD